MLERLPRILPRSDLIRLAASFLLALLLWGWVTSVENPERTRVFSNVPVEVSPLPDTLQVVTSVQNVAVQVQGSQSVVAALNLDDIVARL
nr:hypothetical protein [Chloroflexota bacterium]